MRVCNKSVRAGIVIGETNGWQSLPDTVCKNENKEDGDYDEKCKTTVMSTG
jgi:hypothetical protein